MICAKNVKIKFVKEKTNFPQNLLCYFHQKISLNPSLMHPYFLVHHVFLPWEILFLLLLNYQHLLLVMVILFNFLPFFVLLLYIVLWLLFCFAICTSFLFKHCNSNSCHSFWILKALAKSKGKLIVIVMTSRLLLQLLKEQ